MPADVVFLDTNGWLALLNASDQLHRRADTIWRSLGDRGCSIVLTDWIIAETGNGLARTAVRGSFASIAAGIINNSHCHIVFMTPGLLRRAVDLYHHRADKQWGLVDCASFLVMADEQIAEAFTTDRHFEQAGFKAMLL